MNVHALKSRSHTKIKERQDFEEDNFTRLNLTGADKREKKQAERVQSDFGIEFETLD